MKTIPVFVFSILLLSLTSCGGNADGKSKNASSDTPKVEREDFYEFLDEFSTKRIFQMERIVFPISVSVPDANEIALTPTETKIERQDWELLDLTYDDSYATRDNDQYTQTITFEKDTARVSLRGIDNGIYADYYFHLIKGEWFLVKLVE